MGEYDKHIVPTPIEQRERDYPEWAESLPRMRTISHRILARAGSIEFTDPATDRGAGLRAWAVDALERLELEGPNPVYDDLSEERDFDPVRAMQLRNRYAFGMGQLTTHAAIPPRCLDIRPDW